jgi:hypothetical protein
MPVVVGEALAAPGAVLEPSPPEQPATISVAARNPAILINDAENCRFETKAAPRGRGGQSKCGRKMRQGVVVC